MAKPATKKPDAVPRFAQWITKRGASQLARDLGVTRFTIHSWIRGAINLANGRPLGARAGTRPSPDRLSEIIALAEGALNAADIYPATQKGAAKS